MQAVAKSEVSGLVKKVSPAAMGKTQPICRTGMAAARMMASRWLP